MPRTIELSKTSSRYTYGRVDGIRVRMEVACAEEMPTKIFAYRTLPMSPYATEREGVFSHICSPSDLEEYPEDTPLPDHSPEWFRLDYVDIIVRSPDEAQAAVDVIYEDVQRLKLTLDTMDTLEDEETFTIGLGCAEDDDSSDSSGDSSGSGSSGETEYGDVLSVVAISTTVREAGGGVDWIHVGDGAGSHFLPSETSSSGDPSHYSYVELRLGQTSRTLIMQGFDLSEIPEDALITGIEFVVSAKDPGDGDPCSKVLFAAIHHPEQGVVGDMASDLCLPVGDWGPLVYGDEIELWGLDSPIYGADLLDGGFGVAVVLGCDFDADTVRGEIDGAIVTVYYRPVQ